MEAQKNDKEESAKQSEDNSTSVLDDRALSTNNSNNKSGESVTKETTENGNSSDAIREHNPIINHGSDTSSNLKELGEKELLKDEKTGIVKESENLESKLTSNPVETSGEGTTVEKPLESTLSSNDVHMSDLQHAEKSEIQKQVPPHSAKTSKEVDDETKRLSSGDEPQPISSANSVKEASNDVAMVSDSHDKNEARQTETSKSLVNQGPNKVSDSLPSEENASTEPVKSNSAVERRAGTCPVLILYFWTFHQFRLHFSIFFLKRNI